MQIGVRCMLMRGGTSKGAYFLASDLPKDIAARDRLLLSIMGSPDPRQIDGLGGAHPLTSKAAIVAKSNAPGIDIDFLFAQVGIEKAQVDTSPNCGNILSGVGAFAVERGLIEAKSPITRMSVRTLNTGTIAELVLQTPDGKIQYEGAARIDGVPSTASPVAVNFLDAAGSLCGDLLPSGKNADEISGIRCTLIDNGMPVIVLKAADVGRTGYESVVQLSKDSELKSRLEDIRLKAGAPMRLGDVKSKVVPKVCLVAEPRNGGDLSTRCFIPHEVHASLGVFAAVSIATAAVLPGSPASEVARIPEGRLKTLSLEHPTGKISVALEVEGSAAQPVVTKAGLIRTARKLFDGTTFAEVSDHEYAQIVA